MKNLIAFIKKYPFYFTGYGVTAVTYFSYHGPQMRGITELGINFIAALLVGCTSWLYVVARVINSFCT